VIDSWASGHKFKKTETAIKKFDYVDAMRGLAIAGVLITHINGRESSSPFLFGAISQSAMGVRLFFFVSAFTLFSSLTSRREVDHRPFLNFFIRRFFRIPSLFLPSVIAI